MDLERQTMEPLSKEQQEIRTRLVRGIDMPESGVGAARAMRGLASLIEAAKPIYPKLDQLSRDFWVALEWIEDLPVNYLLAPVAGSRTNYLLYSVLCKLGEISMAESFGDGKRWAALRLVSLVFRGMGESKVSRSPQTIRNCERELLGTCRCDGPLGGKSKTASSTKALDKFFEQHRNIFEALFIAGNQSGSGQRIPDQRTQEEKLKRHFAATKRTAARALVRAANTDGVSRAQMDAIRAGFYGDIKTGNEEVISAVLMTLMGITRPLLRRTQVRVSGEKKPTSMLWICLVNGTVNRDLYLLKEEGALPARGTEGLYEPACWAIGLKLSPVLADALRSMAHKQKLDAIVEYERLTESGLANSRSSLSTVASHRKITHVQLARALTAFLIEDKHGPWEIACALGAFYLVPGKREHYGAIPLSKIQAIFDAAQNYAGIPTTAGPVRSGKEDLIGCAVSPRDATVKMAYHSLSAKADDFSRTGLNTRGSLIDELNANAAWMAFFIAHHLALRGQEEYRIPYGDILKGQPFKFSDKGPVDAVELLPPFGGVAEIIRRWVNYLTSLCLRLDMTLDPVAKEISLRIRARLVDLRQEELIFTVNRMGRLFASGTKTWRQEFPEKQRLVGNWARHYWATKLAEINISQRAINILLRHHVGSLSQGAQSSGRSLQDVHDELERGMKIILVSLDFKTPQALSKNI